MATITVTARDRASVRWLYYAFFSAVFFPYMRVLPIGSDLQPTAVVLAAVILMGSTSGRMPRAITPLFVVMIAAALIALVTGINITAVRGLANYFSLFIIAFATYSALKAERGLSCRFMKAIIWIWFTVGLIQVTVSRGFLTQLLSDARTTANRGVVGLAPEPTFYGIHCLILLVIVSELFTGRTRRILVAALLLQIIVFARSSMAILFLLIWGAVYVITRVRGRNAVVGAVVISGLALIVLWELAQLAEHVQGVRVLDEIRLVVMAPALVLARDASTSERVAGIVFSFLGAVQGWLLPHGFISWSRYTQEIGPRLVRYIPYYTTGDRIMSGYGAALYELGFVGLIIPYVVTHTARLRYVGDRKRFITIAVLLNLLFLTAVPLAYPPIGFLIGYFCYYGIPSQHSDIHRTGVALAPIDGILPA